MKKHLVSITALMVALASIIVSLSTRRQVSHSKLDEDVTIADSAKRFVVSLQGELRDARRRISELDAKLTTASLRLHALEERKEGSSAPIEKVAATFMDKAFPLLTEGSYALERGAVVYSLDAKLQIADGMTVSSPSGVMVSDYSQKMVVGDLKLENGDSTMDAKGAVIDVAKHSFTAESVEITPKTRPNKN